MNAGEGRERQLTAPPQFLTNNNSSNVVRHVHDRRRPCRIDLPPFNGYDAIIRASRWQCQRSRRKLLFMPLLWFRYASSRTLHACTDVHRGHYARMILLFHRLVRSRSIWSQPLPPVISSSRFRNSSNGILKLQTVGKRQMICIYIKRIEFMIVKIVGMGSCDCASVGQ